MKTIREQSFLIIQNNKELYQDWVYAKNESERTDILLKVAYELGTENGISYTEYQINS